MKSFRREIRALGVIALALFVAAILLASVGLAQRPDRVLYPVKAGQEDAGRKPAHLDWRVGDGITYENMTVFPLLARQGVDTSAFVTLDEALASGDAVVSESGSEIIRRSRDGRPIRVPDGGGPQVNRLVLVYRGKRPLVLLAGELVSGGKQDRIIAKDRIVPPGAQPLPLDVFCVEHGRWTGGGQFNASKYIVHPSVREKAAVDQKQQEVWAAVRSGTTSDTGSAGGAAAAPPPALSRARIAGVMAQEAQSESYAKVYHDSRVGQSVESFAAEVERRFARATSGLKGERVVGVVVAYGADVAWSDAFASADLFEKYWPKLLRSYVVEALARPGTREHAGVDDAREFLRPLGGRENIESELGVYRWRQITQGRYAQIELDALAPLNVTLHRVKIQRTS